MCRISKEILDNALRRTFDMESFLAVDPVGLVYELRGHTRRQLDIELGALFTAMISWGNRKAIRSAVRRMLCDEMGWEPGNFILSGRYRDSYLTARNNCVYRTLNRDAFLLVCDNIRRALVDSGAESLEAYFREYSVEDIIAELADWLRPARLGTFGSSACKRICMFLRWMIRRGEPDLGLWTSHDQADLYAVMDVHVCQLTSSILTHKQASWRSCCELTGIFREWDGADPLKYDIALMTVADNGN